MKYTRLLRSRIIYGSNSNTYNILNWPQRPNRFWLGARRFSARRWYPLSGLLARDSIRLANVSFFNSADKCHDRFSFDSAAKYFEPVGSSRRVSLLLLLGHFSLVS